MTIESLGLFKAMGAKMDYLNLRQKVLSDNIANADTPGYAAHDLKPVDFATVMKKVVKPTSLSMETSNTRHIPPPGAVADPKNAKSKMVYEVAPSGNNISLEEQAISSRKTTMDYNLMLNLFKKNTGMLNTALGAQSGS